MADWYLNRYFSAQANYLTSETFGDNVQVVNMEEVRVEVKNNSHGAYHPVSIDIFTYRYLGRKFWKLYLHLSHLIFLF